MRNISEKRRLPQYRRCSFTGHRPQKLPFGFDEQSPRYFEFKQKVYDAIEALIGQGYAHFLSGGALGMDMLAAEAVIDLKMRYPWIVLEMVLPFDGQADRWDEAHRRRHRALLAAADIVTATGHAYTRSCLFLRNRYLVDHADLLLAAFDGRPGGTAMTVAYAQARGVPVQNLLCA